MSTEVGTNTPTNPATATPIANTMPTFSELTKTHQVAAQADDHLTFYAAVCQS